MACCSNSLPVDFGTCPGPGPSGLDYIVPELNNLDNPHFCDMSWKDVCDILAAYQFFTREIIQRRLGIENFMAVWQQFEVCEVRGVSFYRAAAEGYAEDRVARHLESLGFERRSKNNWRKGDIDIRFEGAFNVRISFANCLTGLDYTLLADVRTSDLGKLPDD